MTGENFLNLTIKTNAGRAAILEQPKRKMRSVATSGEPNRSTREIFFHDNLPLMSQPCRTLSNPFTLKRVGELTKSRGFPILGPQGTHHSKRTLVKIKSVPLSQRKEESWTACSFIIISRT